MTDELEIFKAEAEKQIADAGCLGIKDWIEKNPGKHLTATYRGFRSCAICGLVEQNGGYRRECRGPVQIVTRAVFDEQSKVWKYER